MLASRYHGSSTRLDDFLRDKRVVVLGAGGAARAVVFRLVREGAQVLLANRSRERAERLAQAVVDAGYGSDAVQTLAREE